MKKPFKPTKKISKQTKGKSSQKHPKAPLKKKRWDRVPKLQPMAQAKIVQMAAEGKSFHQIREELGHDKNTIKAVVLHSQEMELIKGEVLGIIAKHLPEGAKSIAAALFLDYKFALEVFARFGILPAATAKVSVEAPAGPIVTALSNNLPYDETKIREVPGDTVELYGSKISKTYLPFFARFFEVMDIGDKENGLKPPEYLPGMGLPEVEVKDGKIVNIRPPKITPVPEDGEQKS